MITWNGYAEPEVEASTLVAVAPSGTLLTYSPGGTVLGLTGNTGKLGLLTAVDDPIDALMVSEIIDAASAKDQQYIYTDIDYSYWTKIGDNLNVLKNFKGLTVYGMPMTAPPALYVDTVTVTAGGSGYGVSGAAVTAVGGTGAGFTGTTVAVGGVITGIVVTNPGSYTVAPTGFTAPVGTLMTATCVLTPHALPAGSEMIANPATSQLKVRPAADATSPTVAVLIDGVSATATTTGKVHMQ